MEYSRYNYHSTDFHQSGPVPAPPTTTRWSWACKAFVK